MYLAVDIGGTKTLFACFTNEGKLLETLKFETPKKYSKFEKVFESAFKNLKHQGYTKAVVAVPGKLDRINGLVLGYGTLPWKPINIRKSLEKILQIPVTIENDCKLAALSEGFNLINEYKKALYVTVSTGISAGLITNGRIDPALADSESGQMRFEHDGKYLQWEDFASGKAIVKKYGKRASEITDPKAWKEIAHNISLGLIELIAVIQPEVIILGGGVGTHFDKYKKPLLDELRRYSLPLVPLPPIVKAKHPEEAVIYGCFLLAKDYEKHAPIFAK